MGCGAVPGVNTSPVFLNILMYSSSGSISVRGVLKSFKNTAVNTKFTCHIFFDYITFNV